MLAELKKYVFSALTKYLSVEKPNVSLQLHQKNLIITETFLDGMRFHWQKQFNIHFTPT